MEMIGQVIFQMLLMYMAKMYNQLKYFIDLKSLIDKE
jgi:hypothetical protein